MGGLKRFAEVAGGQEAVMPVIAIEEEDVDVAMELAMLEAIVKEMDLEAIGLSFGFGEEAGVIALGSHIDRNAGGAGDQQWLIAEI
jgi:hypothetical protein